MERWHSIKFDRQDHRTWPWLHQLESHHATHGGNLTAQPHPLPIEYGQGLLHMNFVEDARLDKVNAEIEF
jgi:hypothetical protein